MKDITYTKREGIAEIAINRPEVYNAFHTLTMKEMGLVNKVEPVPKLKEEAEASAKEICNMSPTSIKSLKFAFSADTDHMYGFENLSQAAVRLYWGTEETAKTKKAWAERKKSC